MELLSCCSWYDRCCHTTDSTAHPMPQLLPHENCYASSQRACSRNYSHTRKIARNSWKQQRRLQPRDVSMWVLWRLQSPNWERMSLSSIQLPWVWAKQLLRDMWQRHYLRRIKVITKEEGHSFVVGHWMKNMYTCNYCSKTYAWRASVKRHINYVNDPAPQTAEAANMDTELSVNRKCFYRAFYDRTTLVTNASKTKVEITFSKYERFQSHVTLLLNGSCIYI